VFLLNFKENDDVAMSRFTGRFSELIHQKN